MATAPGLEIDLKDDLAQISATLKNAGRQALPGAAAQALNRTSASVRGEAVRAMAAETGIKQKDIRAAVTLSKASRVHLQAEIRARGRPLNVIRFMTAAQISRWLNAPRRPRPPIKAKPWGISRVYSNRVFIGNDGRTLFIREAGGGRLQIRGLAGPSIGKELVQPAVTAAIMRQFRARWPVEFERAMSNALRKLGYR